MTQIKNKKKQAISGKKRLFSTREIPKNKGKNPGQDVSVNLSENITHNNRNNDI